MSTASLVLNLLVGLAVLVALVGGWRAWEQARKEWER